MCLVVPNLFSTLGFLPYLYFYMSQRLVFPARLIVSAVEFRSTHTTEKHDLFCHLCIESGDSHVCVCGGKACQNYESSQHCVFHNTDWWVKHIHTHQYHEAYQSLQYSSLHPSWRKFFGTYVIRRLTAKILKWHQHCAWSKTQLRCMLSQHCGPTSLSIAPQETVTVHCNVICAPCIG